MVMSTRGFSYDLSPRPLELVRLSFPAFFSRECEKSFALPIPAVFTVSPFQKTTLLPEF